MKKVLHGDCLELMMDIPANSIDMIFCDLPYGTTACKWDVIIPFNRLWLAYNRIIKDDGAIVLTASQPFTSALVMSNPGMFRYEIIWNKNKASNFMLSKKQILKFHESILVFYKKQPTFNPPKVKRLKENMRPAALNNKVVEVTGQRRKVVSTQKDEKLQGSVVFNNTREYGLHPNQKPVSLLEYLIKIYTNEGDLVLDNCAGSGSTAIACINTNRDYILMEKEEKYFEIINERILTHEQ